MSLNQRHIKGEMTACGRMTPVTAGNPWSYQLVSAAFTEPPCVITLWADVYTWMFAFPHVDARILSKVGFSKASSDFHLSAMATLHTASMQDSRMFAGEPGAPKYFPFTLGALHGARLIKRFHGATDSVRLCNREWTKVMKVSRSSNFDSELDPGNFDVLLNTDSASDSQRLDHFAKAAP